MNKYISILFCFLFFPHSVLGTSIRGFPHFNSAFPNDLSTLDFVKDLTGAALVKDKHTQQLFVLKSNPLAEAMKEEILADALYRKLGVPVPDFATYSYDPTIPLLMQLGQFNPNAPIRLSFYIQSHPDGSSINLRDAERAFLKKHFILDAYLSNWDVVATKDRTNTILDKDATAWRIDNGGSLLRRAKGLLKSDGSLWSLKRVTELQTLVDPILSPGGAQTYGTLSDNEVIAQIEWLLSKEQDIMETFKAINKALNFRNKNTLFQFLTHRLDDLREHLHHAQHSGLISDNPLPHADPYKRVNYYQDNVYICLYTRKHNIPQVLVGTCEHSSLWGFPGGNTLGSDTYLFESASHWMSYDTVGHIGLSAQDICTAPFHEIILNEKLYRLYFIELPQIHSVRSFQTVSTHHNRTFKKLTWLPLAYIRDKACLTVDQIGNHSNYNTPLSPRFDSFVNKIFQQPSVIKFLDALEHNNPLPLLRSRSYVGPKRDASALDAQSIETKVTLKHSLENTHETYKLTRSILTKAQSLTELKTATPTLTQHETKCPILNNELALLRSQKEAFYAPYPPIPTLQHSYFKLIPLTQTQAYLCKIMGDRYRARTQTETAYNYARMLFTNYCTSASQLLSPFKNDHTYLYQMAEILSAELAQPGNCVFYHATCSEMAFMYDLFTEFRSQLMMTDLSKNLVLRAVDHAFFELSTIDQFYDYFSRATDTAINYAEIKDKKYADQGLSVNCFLVGSDYWPTSCSAYMFYNGHSKYPPDINTLYKSLYKALRFKGDFVKLKKLYESTFRSNSDEPNGALLQFFIDPSVVDDVAYMAIPGGRKLDYAIPNASNTLGVREFLRYIREDPTCRLLESKEALFNMQARLFLKPSVMLNPYTTTTITYWRHPLSPKQQKIYKTSLRKFVSDEITRMLTTYSESPVRAFHTHTHYPSTSERTGEPTDLATIQESSSSPTFPLQRLHRYVCDNLIGTTPNPNTDEADYIRLITQGCSAESLKEFLEHTPNINVNADVIIKYQDSTRTETFHPITIFIQRQEFQQALLIFNHPRFDIKLWDDELDQTKQAFLTWLFDQLEWTVDNFMLLMRVSPNVMARTSARMILDFYDQTLPSSDFDQWNRLTTVLDPEDPKTHLFYRKSCCHFMDYNLYDDLFNILSLEGFSSCLDSETFQQLLTFLIRTHLVCEAVKLHLQEAIFPLRYEDYLKVFEPCTNHALLKFYEEVSKDDCNPSLSAAIATLAIKRNCPSILSVCLQEITSDEIITKNDERLLDLFAINLLNSPKPFYLDDYEDCLDLLLEKADEIENPLLKQGSILQILCGDGSPNTNDLLEIHTFENIYIKLLKAGANPHGKPKSPFPPPLYTAFKMESEILIDCLLQYGADPTVCFRTPPKNASFFARAFPPCSILVEGIFTFQFMAQAPSSTFYKFLQRAYEIDPVSFTSITDTIMENARLANWIKETIRERFPIKKSNQLSVKERLEFYITHHDVSELEKLLIANPNMNLDSVTNARMHIHGYKPKRLPALILAGSDSAIIRVLMAAGAKLYPEHPFYAAEYKSIDGLLQKQKMDITNKYS